MLIFLSLFVVTTPLHRWSVAKMAWNRLASVGRMLTILGFWLVVKISQTSISHVSSKVYRKPASMITTYPLPAGMPTFPTNAYCSRTGKRTSRIRSVARTVSSRRRNVGRAESFLALSNRGLLSILDASFKFARASDFISGEPCLTVRMEQTAVFGVIVGLTSASVRLRQEKGFAVTVREGCRELASEAGRVSGQGLREASGPMCQVACASLHRSGCRLGVFKFGRG